MIDIYPIANAAPSVYRKSIISLLEGFVQREPKELVVSIIDTSNPDHVPLSTSEVHYYVFDKSLKRKLTPPNPRELTGCWMRLAIDGREYPYVLMSGPTEPGSRKGWIVFDKGIVSSEFTVPETKPRQYQLYTGIGSRGISGTEALQLIELSKVLSSHGWLPRSGHAIGTDYVIELGARYGWRSDEVGPEIFLPYDGFNGGDSKTDPWLFDTTKLPLYEEAKQLARTIHPNPDALKGFALAAHTRNVFQVLGADLKSPSSFLLVCADPVSKKSQNVKGGTGTAVRIALEHGIKVYNLRQTSFEELLTLLSCYKV